MRKVLWGSATSAVGYVPRSAVPGLQTNSPNGLGSLPTVLHNGGPTEMPPEQGWVVPISARPGPHLSSPVFRSTAPLVGRTGGLCEAQPGFISSKADRLIWFGFLGLVSHLVLNVGRVLLTSPPNPNHCLCVSSA